MTRANNLATEGAYVDSNGVLQPAGGGTGLSGVGLSGQGLISDGAKLIYGSYVSGYSGISGYSGYSGVTGSNGTSGYSGISGYSGTSGYSGSGISGYSGSGVSGYSGFSGYSGSAAASPIPSGSVFVLYQSSAPTGWTQVTTLNDYALRIVSGTGGRTGGTTAFSTVFANQTPTINVSGLSAGATTLSTTQIPSHNHSVGNQSSALYLINTSSCSGTSTAQPGSGTTGSQGGGGSHTHSISGSATSSAVTLNVLYANMIICSKN